MAFDAKLNYTFVDSIAKLNEAEEYIFDYRRNSFGVDTETTGLNPFIDKVLMIQIGNSARQFVIDVYKTGFNQVADFMARLALLDNRKFVFHNAVFDLSMLRRDFRFDPDQYNIACTLVGAKLISNGNMLIHNDLGSCLEKYAGVRVDKKEQKSFIGMKIGDGFTESQIEYAARDVKFLLPTHKKIEEVLAERNQTVLYEMENLVIPSVVDLYLNGIYLDGKQWSGLESLAKDRLDASKAKLDEHFKNVVPLDLFGTPVINYNSPDQLLVSLNKLFKEELGLKNVSLSATGKDDLVKINQPAIKDLLAYREAAKKVSTYGKKFLIKYVNPETGRVHSQFKQLGAESGRMASKEPNMQNIPKEQVYRSCFTAQHPDYRIISADFSGQELRVLAHITGEKKFLFAINNEMDLHSYSASLIFDIPYEDFLEKDPLTGKPIIDKSGDPVIKPKMKKDFRNPAKSITFGLIYGMGPGKLANDLGITMAEAIELMDKYFETFPKIKTALTKFEKDAKANKYAFSPLDSRRRDLSSADWMHPGTVAHLLNIAKNMPFQSAGASITKLALVRIRARIKEELLDARLINVVHDEILVEVHKDQAEEVADIVQKEMISAFNVYVPGVPMVVKPEIADTWIH